LSICRKRLLIWLLLAGVCIAAGITTDLILKTKAFPVPVRLAGLIGMLFAHVPLRRTGRLLALLGEPQEWGCTSRLITTDIYQCVRHPHHLPWVTHWAPVVVSHYQYESMGMGHRVLIAGGREGTDGEVWRRLQGISSQGTYVIPETDLFFQGPRSIY
jgi:hypothetical protein